MLALTAMLLLANPEPALLSRAEIRAERVRLLDERPSLVVPALGLFLGGALGLSLPIGFLAAATSYYGIAVYMAAILLTGGTVGLAVGVLSAICLVKLRPKVRAADERVKALDDDWRKGRCRTERGEPPCRDLPEAPPAPVAPSVPIFIAPF